MGFGKSVGKDSTGERASNGLFWGFRVRVRELQGPATLAVRVLEHRILKV